jgi:hypothetical protein
MCSIKVEISMYSSRTCEIQIIRSPYKPPVLPSVEKEDSIAE